MTRRIPAVAFAVAPVVGCSHAVAQTAPQGQKSAAQTAKVQSGGIQLKDLPPAVRATVEAETKNATIKGISKEKEKDRPSTSWSRW